jgi:hypothetical protein
MGFLDHQGESEFPFAKETVFNAMLKAIPTVKGMKVDNADKLQGRIVVKAGVSLMSWGENIPILLSEVAENRTQVKITSSPKTGVMFGGAFDLGKNRKNIEQILSATSRILSSSTSQQNQNTANSETTNSNQQTQNFQQNTNMENQQIDKKWYDNKFITHLLLVIFFPVGLYALWKSRTIAKWWKITATVLISLIVIANLGDDGKISDSSNNEGKISNNSNLEEVSGEKNVDKTESSITVSQINALAKAKVYLATMPFSYSGLIQQLEFDQFSNADAIYGADNCNANWDEQAAKKAKVYMSTMAFSRGGLINQLEFDGFTTTQAKYGANAVGL